MDDFEFEGILMMVAVGVGLLALLIFLAVFTKYFRLWIQAYLTKADITIWDLIGMSFRKVNATVITRSKIMVVQAGLGDDVVLTTKSLEAHFLSGGNVPRVIQALIAANKAKTIDLDYRHAAAIDLAGRDVLEAVQTSVYPVVIDCPAQGSARPNLDAVAKDGIQL